MATSNSQDFNVSTYDIITEALQLCGVNGGAEGDIPPDDYYSALRTLNVMVKAWQGEGLFLHTWRDATLFFGDGQGSYLLGTTAKVTESYTETTLSVAAVATDTTITLTSTTGITDGDVIGIQLDDGTMQWTTVTTALGTLIADALTGDAAAGNMVIAYTSAIGRPNRIADLMRRDANGTEYPVELISREEYRRKADKDVTGKTVQAFLDPKTGYSGLSLWPVPDLVTDRLTFSYEKVIDDFDSVTDNPEVPGSFSEALITGLAYRLAPKYRLPVSERNDLMQRAEAAKMAVSDNEDGTSFFIEPRFR